jgi:hypothetical protein
MAKKAVIINLGFHRRTGDKFFTRQHKKKYVK